MRRFFGNHCLISAGTQAPVAPSLTRALIGVSIVSFEVIFLCDNASDWSNGGSGRQNCKDFCKPIQLLRKKSEIELQQPRFKVPTQFFV